MSADLKLTDANDLIDGFVTRRTDASETGSSSGAERYARDVRNDWLPFLREERDKQLWDADHRDAYAYFRNLSNEGYADKTIRLRKTSVSMFYQELYKMKRDAPYEFPNALEERLANAESAEEFDPTSEINLREKFGVGTTSIKSEQMADEFAYLTFEELQRLEEHAPPPRSRNVLILRLLFTTGMRRGELARLKISDVDRERRIIQVPPIKGDKSPREVTYPESVDSLFANYLDRGGRDALAGAPGSPYLFPTERRKHIRPKNVNEQVVKKAAERHDADADPGEELQKVLATTPDGRKLYRVTAHTLRHSYGVKAIKSGIDIRSLQKLMGHESIETTETYLEIAGEDLMEQSRKFDPQA